MTLMDEVNLKGASLLGRKVFGSGQRAQEGVGDLLHQTRRIARFCKQAIMSFRVKRRGGIHRSGTTLSLQKRLQVIKSVILADAAWKNHVSDNTAWRIVRKYQQQLNCHATVGGHFQKDIMKDIVQLYIELLVVMDSTIYLIENKKDWHPTLACRMTRYKALLLCHAFF